MVAGVNPPPIPVPRAFASDPALNDYFQRLHKVIFQLWASVNGGGGSGGDTFITNIEEGDTVEGDTIEQLFFNGASAAQFAAAFSRADDIESDLTAANGRLLAHIGALYQEISNMASSPKSFTLNDSITGVSDATTDLLRTQSSGVGQISMATAYNSSANSETLSVYILGSGIAAADVDPVWVQEIAAGASVILPGLLGHNIPAAGALRAFASTTNVLRVTVSGSDSV